MINVQFIVEALERSQKKTADRDAVGYGDSMFVEGEEGGII